MLSLLVLLTCACAAHSAFVAPERRNIKPTDIAAWRNTVKLNASYLDGLGGGNNAPPSAQTSYSPFKKSNNQPNLDNVQPNFNEAKAAAAEAIGQALEEKASAKEATETSSAETAPAEDESVSPVAIETSYEPVPIVTPEPTMISPTEQSEILPFGPAQMSPNSAIMHGELDPTIPGGETDQIAPVELTLATPVAANPLDRTPKDREYLSAVVDGPSNLNFRDSFAPYPKEHSSVGRGSYSSYTQSWTK